MKQVKIQLIFLLLLVTVCQFCSTLPQIGIGIAGNGRGMGQGMQQGPGFGFGLGLGVGSGVRSGREQRPFRIQRSKAFDNVLDKIASCHGRGRGPSPPTQAPTTTAASSGTTAASG